jgi:hypothetical protein
VTLSEAGATLEVDVDARVVRLARAGAIRLELPLDAHLSRLLRIRVEPGGQAEAQPQLTLAQLDAKITQPSQPQLKLRLEPTLTLLISGNLLCGALLQPSQLGGHARPTRGPDAPRLAQQPDLVAVHLCHVAFVLLEDLAVQLKHLLLLKAVLRIAHPAGSAASNMLVPWPRRGRRGRRGGRRWRERCGRRWRGRRWQHCRQHRGPSARPMRHCMRQGQLRLTSTRPRSTRISEVIS